MYFVSLLSVQRERETPSLSVLSALSSNFHRDLTCGVFFFIPPLGFQTFLHVLLEFKKVDMKTNPKAAITLKLGYI